MEKLLKVDTGNLQIGMYISHLDRPWLETPFLVQGFYVKNRKDIDIISKICEFVYVDSTISARKITSNMSTVSSAMGTGSDSIEFTVTNIDISAIKAKYSGKTETPKNQSGNSLDSLFPGKKIEEYPDVTDWKSEGQAAEEAISGLQRGLKDLLSRNQKGGSLEILKIKQAVAPMIDSVIRSPDACIWLTRMKQQDNYIYQHSLGTSIWAVALGRQFGLPREDLHSLAIGGLLLDIGKLRLDKNLLNAKRRLTAQELKIMKKHVEVGLNLLTEGGMKNQDVLDMVAHHHERHNGDGYPQGLVGDQIPVFARIAALVDCYDAITSDRIYASAMSPSLAIKQLYDWKDIYFQAEIIEEFIQAIGIYPAGTLVELSTGHVAVVVAASRSRRLRPEIMLILNNDKEPLDEIEMVDMNEVTQTQEGKPLDIVKGLEPNAYGIDLSSIAL